MRRLLAVLLMPVAPAVASFAALTEVTLPGGHGPACPIAVIHLTPGMDMGLIHLAIQDMGVSIPGASAAVPLPVITQAQSAVVPLLLKGPVAAAHAGSGILFLPLDPGKNSHIVMITSDSDGSSAKNQLIPVTGKVAETLQNYIANRDPGSANQMLSRVFDAVDEFQKSNGTAVVPLEERFQFRIETPTLKFDSGRALRGVRAVGLMRPSGTPFAKPRPASDLQVKIVRTAIEELPTKAFPQVSKWLDFEIVPVEAERSARKISTLVGNLISRPDEVAGPLSRFLPRLRPYMLTSAFFLRTLRFFGVDFGFQSKGASIAKTLEAELNDFITAFEEILPIFIGQLRTAVSMSKVHGNSQLDLREFVPRWKASEVMTWFGLSVTEQQAEILNAEIERAYMGFFEKVASFMAKRTKRETNESFATLMDALSDDLPRAANHFGDAMETVQRANKDESPR